MGLFDMMGQTQKQVTPDMMRQEIGSLRANPGQYLSGRGFNIPQGMTDPKQITQHLLQTGQVSSGRLQQVMRMFGALK